MSVQQASAPSLIVQKSWSAGQQAGGKPSQTLLQQNASSGQHHSSLPPKQMWVPGSQQRRSLWMKSPWQQTVFS